MTSFHAHGHNHGNNHDHSHTHSSLGDANASHFDQHVASATSMAGLFTPMYRAIESELVARRTQLGLPDQSGVQQTSADQSRQPFRLLDYACGGGHFSKFLLPFVDQVVGMDVSGKSIEAYNAWARENGYGENQMTGYQINMMDLHFGAGSDAAHDAKFHDFDLILVSMALHHVADPELLIERLAQRLRKDTGRLVIVDWGVEGCTLPEIKKMWADHGYASRGAVRRGFAKDEIKGWLEGPGRCEAVSYEVFEEYKEAGEVFIASGKRKDA